MVPKRVMLRPDLSPEAKTLYAYYCVISGNNGGFQPSPREELILKTLGISHTRFLRHRKTLTEAGLIVFSQQRKTVSNGKQLFENAQFLIVKAPASTEDDLTATLPLASMAALQEGVFIDGFGLVPRMVLFDHSLSIEAKAAYAFLCVYANASTSSERTATPSAGLLADALMSRHRVQHAMSELLDAGYIRRERLHNGAFAGMIYILNFEKRPPAPPTDAIPPDRQPQQVQNDTTEMKRQEVQNDTSEHTLRSIAKQPSFPRLSQKETKAAHRVQQLDFDTAEKERLTPVFEMTEKQTAENETAKNKTARYKNTIGNTTKKQIPRPNTSLSVGHGDGQTDRVPVVQERFQRFCVMEAAEQIEADVLRQEHGEIIDAITNLMGDVYASQGGTIRMNGRAYSLPSVAEVYRQLTPRHIEHVLQNIQKYGHDDIRNIQAYLTICLYNAVITCGAREYQESIFR